MGRVLKVGRYSLYILYILGLVSKFCFLSYKFKCCILPIDPFESQLLCLVGVIGGSIAIAEMMGYKNLFDEHPQVISFMFGLLALTLILLIAISFGSYATSINHKWFIFGVREK